MSAHEVRHTIDTYGTNAEFRCTASDGAECHQTCAEGCESWGAMFRRDGKWYHAVLDDCGHVEGEHEMRDYGECLVVEWLDGSDYPYSGPQVAVRAGWSRIETEWDDGYSWRYADEPPADSGGADTRLLAAVTLIAGALWLCWLAPLLAALVLLPAAVSAGLVLVLLVAAERRERRAVRPLTRAERDAWRRLSGGGS